MRAAVGAETTRIVDALPAEHYCGATSLGYARTGHIRSAVNLPWSSVVDPETHAFLPAEGLQRVLDGTGVTPDQRIITYYGGGVAASANAFVMTRLGFTDVAVYMASLEEWAADPDLPLVTGGA